MRIAIIGGTGTLGRLVAAELDARGHEVRAVSRVESFGKGDGDKLLADLSARNVNTEIGDDGVIHFNLKVHHKVCHNMHTQNITHNLHHNIQINMVVHNL